MSAWHIGGFGMKTALVPAVLAFATVAFAAGTHKTEVVAPHQQEIAAKKSTIDELHFQPSSTCGRIADADPMAVIADPQPPTVVRM
jgi:hypothetical protein